MNKRINLIQKVDLLKISLETLESFQVTDLANQKKVIYKSAKNNQMQIINLLKYCGHVKKYKKMHECCNNIVKYIHKIVTKINFYLLCYKANFIIKYYTRQKKPYHLIQYIRKFNYLYLAKHKYYNNYKCIDYQYQAKINKIAIINLYLITKLKSRQGIYFLVKYLYHESTN